MLDLGLIVTRLKTIADMDARVSLAATIQDAIAVNIAQDRYLWLAAPNGASSEPTSINEVRQLRVQRFSVVTLVRNVQDAAGAGALADSAALRQAAVDALLGWVPADGYRAIEHVRDASILWDGARLYWADEFRTSHYLRQA